MILVYHFLTKKNPYFNNKSILNDRQLEIKIPGAFKALDKIPLSFSLRLKKSILCLQMMTQCIQLDPVLYPGHLWTTSAPAVSLVLTVSHV